MLLRPLILQNSRPSLGFANQSVNPAEDTSHACVRQLRRLSMVCQDEFSQDLPTIFLHLGYLYLANAAIRTTDSNKSMRLSDFRLALSFYERLYPRYACTIAIIKGLLYMAYSGGLLVATEANKAVQKITERGSNGTGHLQMPTGVGIVIDLDLAVSHRANALVDCLAQSFDDIAMFDEFIRGGIDDDEVSVSHLDPQ